MGDRGQAFTLEGIVAGLVVLSGLVFAFQATAITPLSASTSNQFIESQQVGSARGVLATAAEEPAGDRDSPLKRAVLFWGDEDGDGTREFHCANNDPYFTDAPDLSACGLSAGDEFAGSFPPNEFGAVLDRAFGTGVGTNVILEFRTPSGEFESQRMVYEGEPSDNAVRVSTFVTVYDTDEVYASDGTRSGDTVTSGAAAFYAPDAHPGADEALYNVIRVEVVVWRI